MVCLFVVWVWWGLEKLGDRRLPSILVSREYGGGWVFYLAALDSLGNLSASLVLGVLPVFALREVAVSGAVINYFQECN